MRKRLSLVAAAAIVLTATACGSNTRDLPSSVPGTATPIPQGPQTTDRAAEGEPRITMNGPGIGAKPYAGNVETSVLVGGIVLVDKLGQPNARGEGHVVFYLDVDDLPVEQGKPAFVDDETKYFATSKISHTWTIDDPGTHTLSAQLVNNDHTPLNPPVTDSLTVEVVEKP